MLIPVQAEIGTVATLPYADGTPGDGAYSWSGTAHNSTSTRLPISAIPRLAILTIAADGDGGVYRSGQQ